MLVMSIAEESTTHMIWKPWTCITLPTNDRYHLHFYLPASNWIQLIIADLGRANGTIQLIRKELLPMQLTYSLYTMYNLVQEADKRPREYYFVHSFTRQLAKCNSARTEEAEDLYHQLILNTRTQIKQFANKGNERANE